MFTVHVPDSTRERCPRAGQLADRVGERLPFTGRAEAEALASALSEDGIACQIQAAAHQDPRPIDAYLVAREERHTHEPKARTDHSLRFDVTANQYGAIGEALVGGEYGVGAGLRYYLEAELGYGPSCRLTSRLTPRAPEDVDRPVRWTPDCRIDVSTASGGEDSIYCEVKAGDASFERGQREGMRAVATKHTVLAVRVRIDGLPEEYELRIEEVDP